MELYASSRIEPRLFWGSVAGASRASGDLALEGVCSVGLPLMHN